MRWYKPVFSGKTSCQSLICNETNMGKYNYFGYCDITVDKYFSIGRWFTDWPEDIELWVSVKEYDGYSDDVLQNAFGLHIYSQRVVDVLKNDTIQDFQFLPVYIKNLEGVDQGRYYIANCLNLVDAFDYEKSGYHTKEDDSLEGDDRIQIFCYKLALKREPLNGYNAIRLYKHGLYNSFAVSERIKEIFKKNGLTGYQFVELEVSD